MRMKKLLGTIETRRLMETHETQEDYLELMRILILTKTEMD